MVIIVENLRNYKSKYEYINDFFLSNNIVLMIADTNRKDKVSIGEINYNNDKYSCVVMDSKMDSSKKFDVLKTIAFQLINRKFQSGYLYVDKRYNIGNEITLSKTMGIKIRKINKKIKDALITYHFFKIKDLINRQKYDNFFRQYKTATCNEKLSKIYYKIEHKIITGTTDEYFYIVTIKNIIHIYSKEVDKKIDYNSPSFEDEMIFKYLDNYFDKYVMISYDEIKVKEFISKYYINEVQAQDLVHSFINEFLHFYQIITNMNFPLHNSYNFDLKKLAVFDYRKASSIKYKDFYKKFDEIIEDEENYYNFMFLLEILELTKSHSDKKDIINYMSIFELLLVKGDKNISSQIQDKGSKFLTKNYSKEEFKLVYDYRSKIIHGDYKRSIDKLQKLSLLPKYRITKEKIQDEIYSNINQILEQKVKDNLFHALVLILRCFVFNNQKIKSIKNL